MPAGETMQLGDLTELIARTIEVFGSADRATRWLKTTNPKLNGRTPLDVYQHFGRERVEEELLAIEHGIVA